MPDTIEELQGKPYEEMSHKELVFLKDRSLLPYDVELKYFKANIGTGGADTGEYMGDENTRNTVAGSGLHPEGDLSGIDRAEAAEAEVERLKADLANAEAQRDAALAGASEDDDAEEDDDEEVEDYSAWTVAELQAEIDERNDGRDTPLPKPSKKGELIAVLQEDDDAEEDE